MRIMTWLAAALAAGSLACAPALAQKTSQLPAAAPASGADLTAVSQGSGCAQQLSPCSGAKMTLAQIAGYAATDPAMTAAYQPLDGDLSSLAGASATNSLYYRASPSTWAPVTLGPNFAFSSGNLTIPGLPITVTGDVSGTTTSTSGALALTLATVPVVKGGTGATTAPGALAAIGGQPSSSILSAIAAQVLNADTCVYWTGASSAATYSCPTFGRKLVGSATGAAAAATIGTSYVLARSTTAQSVTNTTSETTLATITIPAGAIGPNGFVEVNTLWSNTANANSKTMSLRLNGNLLALAVNSSATVPGYRTIWAFNNVNSQASQVGNAGAGSGSSGFALYRTTVDTSVATTLTITGTPSATSDTLTLESWIARITNGQ